MSDEEILLGITDILKDHNKPHGLGISDAAAVEAIRALLKEEPNE